MADIFISYASEDRSRVEPLAKALEDQGWSMKILAQILKILETSGKIQ